jgi:hypothetical protein
MGPNGSLYLLECTDLDGDILDTLLGVSNHSADVATRTFALSLILRTVRSTAMLGFFLPKASMSN